MTRLFRHVFEHPSLKKALGANFAVLIMAGSLLPNGNLQTEAENTVLAAGETQIVTQRNIQYPLKEIRVTQGYSFFHPAVDLDGEIGDSIWPIKDGKVEAVSSSKFAYGNSVIINHGDGMTSLYAHLSQIFVKEGEEVTTLTEIGQVGSTGHSTGPHLHLEIRHNNLPINPGAVLLPAVPVILN